jgi:uncharacterized DUF497 family protein
VVNWNQIVFKEFEYDKDIQEKLHSHGLYFEEVIQCFYNPFQVRRNKKFKDRFQLIGKTDNGRKLKVIFQLKPRNIVRIITGWDL